MTDNELTAAADSRGRLDTSLQDTLRHMDAGWARLDARFDELEAALRKICGKLEHHGTDIRAEMRRGFAETQALLKPPTGGR